MRFLLPALLLALSLPTAASAQIPLSVTSPRVVAVGDVACDPESPFFNNGQGTSAHCRHAHVADMIAERGPDAVLALGDLQYEDAQLWKFEDSYDQSWGRLRPITRPVVGNHEYFGEDGNGYFDYFNGIGADTGPAGDRDKGYYSYDLGGWHIIALNSVCSRVGGCGPGSPQEQWLRADLAAHPNQCVLAYAHHAQYTSSGLNWPSMEPLWQALWEAGAEVLLAAHAHNYERFTRMDPTGLEDRANGIRQFVVGTGGKNLSGARGRATNSEVFTNTVFGALELTLRPDGYDWRYLRESGDDFSDAGSESCHGTPGGRPPRAVTGSASAVRGTAARLNAAVNPRNQPTTYRFDYGRTTAYGSSTLPAAVEDVARRQPVAARITGLRPGETYHYRVVATNASGTTESADRTFVADRRSPYEELVTGNPDLLAYWRMSEDRDDIAFDELGRNLGLFSGGTRLASRGATAGDGDRAPRFDGVTGSMRMFGPSLSTSGTIEGWFRWRKGLVLMRDDSSTGGWIFSQEGRPGRLSYRVAGTGYPTERSLTTVRDNAWRHIVLTKDGPTTKLYIDGRLVHTGTDAGDAASTSPWYVMRNGPFEEHARGRADEIAIYGFALEPSVIKAHYRAGVARSAPQTRIVGPVGSINDPTPTFTARSSERGGKIRCALSQPTRRNPPYANCARRRTVAALVDGTYAYQAYAVDRSGYPDPAPAVRWFTVDTVTPELTVAVPPDVTVPRFLRSGLTATAACSERCALAGRLTLRGSTARRHKLSRGAAFVLARATGSGSSSAAAPVRFVVPRAVARRLRRASVLPMTLTMTARDDAGNQRTVVQRMELRR